MSHEDKVPTPLPPPKGTTDDDDDHHDAEHDRSVATSPSTSQHHHDSNLEVKTLLYDTNVSLPNQMKTEATNNVVLAMTQLEESNPSQENDGMNVDAANLDTVTNQLHEEKLHEEEEEDISTSDDDDEEEEDDGTPQTGENMDLEEEPTTGMSKQSNEAETKGPITTKKKTDEDQSMDDDGKPSYSTRGRTAHHTAPTASTTATATTATTATTTATTVQDHHTTVAAAALDRLAAVGDLLSLGTRPGDIHTTSHSTEIRMRESFLSDSLTEEERRTRTRYLPQVEGMHALRKTEIKSDLALTRGSMSQKSIKRKHKDEESGVDHDTMDTGESGDGGITEDELTSDVNRSSHSTSNNNNNNMKIVEIGPVDLAIPSPAFVLPLPEQTNQPKRPTPRQIEIVTAHNPPRPPESIGAKKKHRMLRWERRPTDMEIDLSNYRKTVQRTRQELNHAQNELNRLIVSDNLYRRHFLQHIQCLNEELIQVGDEYTAVAQECMDVADLPSTRTRTRGAFKDTSTVMREVLYALRGKGKEMIAKGLVATPISSDSSVSMTTHGMGGVSSSSFIDWDRTTHIQPCKHASVWVVPGDVLITPYGEGVVEFVHGPSTLDATAIPSINPYSKSKEVTKMGESNISQNDGDAMDLDTKIVGTSNLPDTTKNIATTNRNPCDQTQPMSQMLAPRVSVRLPFGIAYFNLNAITSKEKPSTYSDERMALRWKGLVETATMMGSTLDICAMADILPRVAIGDEEGGVSKEVNKAVSDDKNEVSIKDKTRLVPFGSVLLPTAAGRGLNIENASMTKLDHEMERMYNKNSEKLGFDNNPGVPINVQEREGYRQRNIFLQARLRQLRHQLYRQRRTRMLNERTYAATQERAIRVESLVSEMRTDLKSLKRRLDQEIYDLGIDEAQAEHILKTFYMSLDSQHQGEASPPKRPRRTSRSDDIEAFDTGGEDDEENMSIPASFVALKAATAKEAAEAAKTIETFY